MADGTNGSGTSDGAGTGGTTTTGAGDGTNGATTTTAATSGTDVDLTKLDATQLEKVLENPNLFNLPRIKELREQAAEAKKLKEDAAKAADENLAKDKKFEELANKRGDENASLKKQLQESEIGNRLTNKLAPLGVVDLDAALKLIDRSKITIKEDGSIEGIDAAIESLKTDKAYLFKGGTSSTVGTATNNGTGGSGAPAKFKRSQLQDPAFYNEHKADILAAYKAGQIEDDIS